MLSGAADRSGKSQFGCRLELGSSRVSSAGWAFSGPIPAASSNPDPLQRLQTLVMTVPNLSPALILIKRQRWPNAHPSHVHSPLAVSPSPELPLGIRSPPSTPFSLPPTPRLPTPAVHSRRAGQVPHCNHLQLLRPARCCQQWAGEVAGGRPGAPGLCRVGLSTGHEATVGVESMGGSGLGWVYHRD